MQRDGVGCCHYTEVGRFSMQVTNPWVVTHEQYVIAGSFITSAPNSKPNGHPKWPRMNGIFQYGETEKKDRRYMVHLGVLCFTFIPSLRVNIANLHILGVITFWKTRLTHKKPLNEKLLPISEAISDRIGSTPFFSSFFFMGDAAFSNTPP